MQVSNFPVSMAGLPVTNQVLGYVTVDICIDGLDYHQSREVNNKFWWKETILINLWTVRNER